MTNCGRRSFVGIRECKLNRRPKLRRRPRSPRFEMLSDESRMNIKTAGPAPGRGSSTRIWTTYSAVGIRNSGRNHKRRNQSARRLDPRPFDALAVDENKGFGHFVYLRYF